MDDRGRDALLPGLGGDHDLVVQRGQLVIAQAPSRRGSVAQDLTADQEGVHGFLGVVGRTVRAAVALGAVLGVAEDELPTQVDAAVLVGVVIAKPPAFATTLGGGLIVRVLVHVARGTVVAECLVELVLGAGVVLALDGGEIVAPLGLQVVGGALGERHRAA